MGYEEQVYKNEGEAPDTPIDAAKLNHTEKGLKGEEERALAVEATKANLTEGKLEESELPSSVVRSSASTIGDGSATSFTIEHGLDSEDVSVACINLTTKEAVVPGVKVLSTSSVEVTFSVAPEANSRRIIVQRSI